MGAYNLYFEVCTYDVCARCILANLTHESASTCDVALLRREAYKKKRGTGMRNDRK